ncbi:hypothetical protein FB45DRAFT_898953 [Roridomyces roridus]|uniref:F-box domain-containing protein n=1 Tax=Roridomyces roridus TaxID=1738132 RepID=A0AAD7CCI7_9AGAR|nr:hypothetical protein FB45DRAFT_898953 [Roridomyces roridus]
MARTDNLAAEIWLQCFHHLDHCDLASLSSVCRHFQGLCQPLLFRDLGFRVQKRRDIAEHARLSTIRLEQLATSRHVACVRSWAFRLQKGGRHTPYPQVAQTYSAAINVFCSTLSTYHHLRSLTIHGLAIDDQLRQTLASLPRITDLSLWDSIVLARTGPLLALRSFHLSVSSFGSSQTTAPNQPLRLVSPETLLSLSIDGSSEANALLRTLTRQGTASQLSSLTITLSDVIVDTLFQFLEECPSLTEVAITRASVLTYALPHLPPSAASSLQTFTGPHSVAEAFTLGRPLTSITLLGVHDMHGGALSSSIQSLPPSLRTLSAEMHVGRIHEIAAIIAERFQELEELQLVLLAWDPDHVSVDTPPEQRMARLLPVVTVDDVDSSPFVVRFLACSLSHWSLTLARKFYPTYIPSPSRPA